MRALLQQAARTLYARVIFPTAAISSAVFLSYFVQINYLGVIR